MSTLKTPVKAKLDLSAIIAAEPIPDEPRTLAELHKANGGFPFRAKKIADIPGGIIPLNDLVTFVRASPNNPEYYVPLTDYLDPISNKTCPFSRQVAVWTFA